MSGYKGLCFIIMSFADNPALKDSYELGVKQIVEQLGYECKRVDEQEFNGSIRDRILQNLREADFIIADASQARPNCYYEIGMAHAMGKEVIHIANNSADVHFDIKDFNFIIYGSISELRERLQKRLEHTLANLKRRVLLLTQESSQTTVVENAVLHDLPKEVVTTTMQLAAGEELDKQIEENDLIVYAYQPVDDGVQQAKVLVDALNRQPGKPLIVYFEGQIENAVFALLRQYRGMKAANMPDTLGERLQEALTCNR